MENASTEDLIKWAVEAMKKAQELEITAQNIAISVVGQGMEYKILTPEEVQPFIRGNQGMEVV